MSFVKYFLISILLPFSLSELCVIGNFLPILVNEENNYVIGPDTEACYVYPLTEKNDKISLIFPSAPSASSAEIILYKSKSDISMKDGSYENYHDRFLISENTFKEIDVKGLGEHLFIILRDPKITETHTNIVILVDTQVPIPLHAGKPVTMKYFLSTNIYTFVYKSNKNCTFVYSSKVKLKKHIIASYNNKILLERKMDDTDEILYLISNDAEEKTFYFTVEDRDPGTEDQEFSVILYEKGINQFNEIQKNKIHYMHYINLDKKDETQAFYYYYLIGNSTKTNTINFRLDPIVNTTEYIKIVSGSYHSEKKMESEDFEKNIRFGQNKFPIAYDINSDTYKKIYYRDEDTSYQYRYVYFRVEISKLDTYYSPQYFLITVGDEIEDVEVEQIGITKNKIITKYVQAYIPSYFKLILNPKERYIFASPYPNNTMYIDGDPIKIDENNNYILNEDFYVDEDEVAAITDGTELTVAVFSSKSFEATFYVERYEESDLIILENEKNYKPINITFTEDECIINKKKYLVGLYYKEIYSKNNVTYSKYWNTIKGEIDVYYRNNITLEGRNLFPYNDKYLVPKETYIYINNNVDFFTFVCIKPGKMTLRPAYNIYNETTHKINQNSYKKIKIGEQTEILQLISPLKRQNNSLYCAIYSSQGKKVTITPDTPSLFNQTTIEGDKPFMLKINLTNFEMYQLAIRVNASEKTQIEVVGVITYNFTEYTVLKSNEMTHFTDNLFVKFINKNTSKIKVTIKGLKDVPIVFGLVNLFTNDVHYLPYPTQFSESMVRKNASSHVERLELFNTFYGQNDTKYVAFLFAIPHFRYYEYDAQVDEREGKDDDQSGGKTKKDEKGGNSGVMIFILIIVGSIIVVGIIIVVIVCIIKNKDKDSKFEMDIENMDNQPLSQESRYKDIKSF